MAQQGLLWEAQMATEIMTLPWQGAGAEPAGEEAAPLRAAASLELAIDAVRQAGAEATNRHSAELRKDIHARLLSQGITERHAALLLGPYCPEGAAMPRASRAAPAATR